MSDASTPFLFLDSVFYGSAGFIFIVAGVLVSIRLLNYPDLTVDGSFTLGACVFAKAVAFGINPSLAMVIAAFGGLIAGLATATLNEKLKIGQILSSVIVMLSIIAAAPYILGRATIGLLNQKTVLSITETYDFSISKILIPGMPFLVHPVTSLALLLFALLILFCVAMFFHSGIGLMIRYHGSANTPQILLKGHMYRVKMFSLGLGNMIIGVGGAIEAQRRGGADQNMGIGMILIALASLILGETVLRILLKKSQLSLRQEIAAVIAGTLLYSLLIQTTLIFGPSAVDIRLVSVFFLLVFLAFSSRLFPRNLDMF